MHEVQSVRVDPAERRVWSHGVEITLSRKEFDLLCALISRAGEVVTRDELMRDVWHTTFWTSSKTIDVHLGWVRRKIGDDSRRPHLISTIRGQGLRFELVPGGKGLPVTRVVPPAPAVAAPAPAASAPVIPAPQVPAPAVEPVLPAGVALAD